jgi:hypothetical protein
MLGWSLYQVMVHRLEAYATLGNSPQDEPRGFDVRDALLERW